MNVVVVEGMTMDEMEVMVLVIPNPSRETLLALSHSHQLQGFGLRDRWYQASGKGQYF